MPELAIETFESIDLKDALVVVAFPTTGSASSIAAHYLIRHLDLPLVGHILLPELTGVVAIQDGRVTSSLRIYGGEVQCKLDKGCPRLYIVLTELALPAIAGLRVTDGLISWAKAGGAHLVVSMEGVIREHDDQTADVYCAAPNPDVLKELHDTGIPVMERALLGGPTANLLLLGPARGVRCGALIVEASREHPDGHAAAALIGALDKLLPDVPLDAKPLLAEAMAIDKQIRNAQQSAEAALHQPPASQFI